jgi:hypothetical protein
MNKEQAIRIIHEEYDYGYSPSDIAQNLSQQLGAPYEVVFKFVMQTLDAKIQNAAEESVPSPVEQAEAQPPVYDPLMEKLPPEPAVRPAEPSPPPAFLGSTAPDLKALEQNPKVEKFVLQRLASNRKTSDTVLEVCERTGLGWDEAQRLVSHIAAKNHKALAAKQNWAPMIFSIIALVVGGLLIFAGISEAYNIYIELQGTHSGEELVMKAASREFLRRTFWALVTGGALLLGGAIGLFIALRRQFE